MIPISFIYTENGNEKTSLDEHKKRVEILEHNKRLNQQYSVQIAQLDKVVIELDLP